MRHGSQQHIDKLQREIATLGARLSDAVDACEVANRAILETQTHVQCGVLPLLKDIRNRGVDLPASIQRSLRSAISILEEGSEQSKGLEVAYKDTDAICKQHKVGSHRPIKEVRAMLEEYDEKHGGSQ